MKIVSKFTRTNTPTVAVRQGTAHMADTVLGDITNSKIEAASNKVGTEPAFTKDQRVWYTCSSGEELKARVTAWDKSTLALDLNIRDEADPSKVRARIDEECSEDDEYDHIDEEDEEDDDDNDDEDEEEAEGNEEEQEEDMEDADDDDGDAEETDNLVSDEALKEYFKAVGESTE